MASATLEDVVTQIGIAIKDLKESQQETERVLKEQAAETDRVLKKQNAEYAEHRKEISRELAEAIKKMSTDVSNLTVEVRNTSKDVSNLTVEVRNTSKDVSNLTVEVRNTSKDVSNLTKSISTIGNNIGTLVEFIVIPGIRPLMKEYGHNLNNMAPNKKIKAFEREIAEVDIFLQGDTEAMAVEVKTRLSISYVKKHVERLKTLRAHANEANIQNKKLYGAIIGLFIDNAAQALAQQEGLYVVEIVEESERLEIVLPVDNIKSF